MRYYLLKDLKISKDEVLKRGQYVEREIIENMFGDRLRIAIRGCILIDTEFGYKFGRFDRNKIVMQMRLLGDIGNDETKRLADLCITNLATKLDQSHYDFYMSKYETERAKKKPLTASISVKVGQKEDILDSKRTAEKAESKESGSIPNLKETKKSNKAKRK